MEATKVTDWQVAAVLAVVGAALQPVVGDTAGVLCPLRRVTSVPCPLCGLTGASASLLRGDVVTATARSPLSWLAAALVVAAIASLWSVGVRRWLAGLSPPVTVVVAGLAASWVYQLQRFGVVL